MRGEGKRESKGRVEGSRGRWGTSKDDSIRFVCSITREKKKLNDLRALDFHRDDERRYSLKDRGKEGLSSEL